MSYSSNQSYYAELGLLTLIAGLPGWLYWCNSAENNPEFPVRSSAAAQKILSALGYWTKIPKA
jgi:hypothetical protein